MLRVPFFVRSRDRSLLVSSKKIQQRILEFVGFLRVNPVSCTLNHVDLYRREELSICVTMRGVDIVGFGAGEEQARFMIVAGRMPGFREIKDVGKVVRDYVQVKNGHEVPQDLVGNKVREQESSNGFLLFQRR